jgi:hypothetical protein
MRTVFIALSLAVVAAAGGPAFAQASRPTAPAPAPLLAQASTGQSEIGCQVLEVSAFANRVHLVCGDLPSPDSNQESVAIAHPVSIYQGTTRYLAVETGSVLAPILIAMGHAAMAANQPLYVIHAVGAGSNPPGCLPADCRRALGFRFYRP